MRKRTRWILAFVLLAGIGASLRHSPPPSIDASLVGSWSFDPGPGEPASTTLVILAADGSWSYEYNGSGIVCFFPPTPTRTWSVADGELRLQETYPVWPNDGGLTMRVSYSADRIMQCLRGEMPLRSVQVQRFRREAAVDGTQWMKEIHDQPVEYQNALRRVPPETTGKNIDSAPSPSK